MLSALSTLWMFGHLPAQANVQDPTWMTVRIRIGSTEVMQTYGILAPTEGSSYDSAWLSLVDIQHFMRALGVSTEWVGSKQAWIVGTKDPVGIKPATKRNTIATYVPGHWLTMQRTMAPSGQNGVVASYIPVANLVQVLAKLNIQTNWNADVLTLRSASHPLQPGYLPFIGVHMVTSRVGWGIAQHQIWRTLDGGKVWQNVTPNLKLSSGGTQSALTKEIEGAMLSSGNGASSFIGTNCAWLSIQPDGAAPPLSKSHILLTTNGGRQWHLTTLPYAADGASVQILTAKIGYAMLHLGAALGSEGVVVLRTNDGGFHWKKISSAGPQGGNISFGGDKTGISFISAKRGWITGVTNANGVAWLYRTDDGGKSWHSQNLPSTIAWRQAMFEVQPPKWFGKEDTSGQLSNASAATGRTRTPMPQSASMSGILPVFVNSRFVLFHSDDGGLHWHLPAQSGLGGPTERVASYDIVSPQVAMAVVTTLNRKSYTPQDATVYSTTNGGQTWNRLSRANPLTYVRELDFVNAHDGWAISGDGVTFSLFHTTDGGQRWRRANDRVEARRGPNGKN